MELNPNHQTTQELRGMWHKLVAVLMCKFGETHVVLTAEDVACLSDETFIVAQELHDGLHLRFVDKATAHQLAREHGGLPS